MCKNNLDKHKLISMIIVCNKNEARLLVNNSNVIKCY